MIESRFAPERPVVTVCVLTYNHGRYIEDCLLSVLYQDPSIRTEILVGDDASSDDTSQRVARLAELHPGRITLHTHPVNLGATRNYQFLIARAEGDWIAYLDGDDFWQPGKLRAQLAFLHAHPAVVACYTDAMAIGFDNSAVGVFSGPHPPEFDTECLVEGGNFLCHSSMLYRRSARDAILSLSEAFIDYRIHLRLSRLGPLGFVNEVLTAYRVFVPNSMTARSPLQVRQLYWEALTEACLELAGKPAVVRGLARFLGAAVVHGVLLRKPFTVQPWFASLRSKFPGIATQVTLRSAAAALLLVLQVGWRNLDRRVSGSSLRILFPRRDRRRS